MDHYEKLWIQGQGDGLAGNSSPTISIKSSELRTLKKMFAVAHTYNPCTSTSRWESMTRDLAKILGPASLEYTEQQKQEALTQKQGRLSYLPWTCCDRFSLALPLSSSLPPPPPPTPHLMLNAVGLFSKLVFPVCLHIQSHGQVVF